MDTPPPSPEVYIMAGIVGVAVFVIVLRCCFKKWLSFQSPKVEGAQTEVVRKPKKMEVSKPPSSTFMIAVFSPASPSSFTSSSTSPADFADGTPTPKFHREGSNISEWYYSLEERGERPGTSLSVLHPMWPLLTPVEEASSESSSLNRVESECNLISLSQTSARTTPSPSKPSTPVTKVKAAQSASSSAKAVSFVSQNNV